VNVYAGTVRHRRFAVREHAFRYRVAMAYFDVDAPPPSHWLVRFRRADYLGDPRVGLGDAVRALVRERTGEDTAGPIRVLTTLRTFGHAFNPVSFYYCFGAGETLEYVVAEVTNTPWGERHAYVMRGRSDELSKQLHVSPFMGMDHTYELHAGLPGETLSVHIASRREGNLAFDATLALRRRPFSRRALAGASLRTLVLIYAHAVALRLKGVRIHPHPTLEASR
jgi:DUF1365 family protein